MKDMKSKVINGLIKGCINVGEKSANTFSFAFDYLSIFLDRRKSWNFL